MRADSIHTERRKTGQPSCAEPHSSVLCLLCLFLFSLSFFFLSTVTVVVGILRTALLKAVLQSIISSGLHKRIRGLFSSPPPGC